MQLEIESIMQMIIVRQEYRPTLPATSGQSHQKVNAGVGKQDRQERGWEDASFIQIQARYHEYRAKTIGPGIAQEETPRDHIKDREESARTAF